MLVANWKYYIIDREISKIILIYLSKSTIDAFNFLDKWLIHHNSLLTWDLPKWTIGKSTDFLKYNKYNWKVYYRAREIDYLDPSLLNFEWLLKLKIRRDKLVIVIDYSVLFIDIAFRAHKRYVKLFLKSGKRFILSPSYEMLILMLIMDFLIIEIIYYTFISSKLALFEMSVQFFDGPVSLAAASKLTSYKSTLRPVIRREMFDIPAKVNVWKMYTPKFLFYSKNAFSSSLKYNNLGGFSSGLRFSPLRGRACWYNYYI